MEILHSIVLGQGRPLLILHGFLGMSDNWKTLGKRYAENGWQVHLLDQRNHGHSFWSPDFDYSLMVEDLKHHMEANGLDQAVLLGHSMGGKTAMNFACTYPEKTQALLVADIGPKAYPPHHQDILNALNQLDLPAYSSRSEADKALENYIRNWGIRQFLLKNLYWKEKGLLGFRMNLGVLSNKMEEIGEALSKESRYSGPTLFIRGGRSFYITDEDLQQLREHFPDAELQTIEGAGHWLHAEQPEAFFRLSLEFLNS